MEKFSPFIFCQRRRCRRGHCRRRVAQVIHQFKRHSKNMGHVVCCLTAINFNKLRHLHFCGPSTKWQIQKAMNENWKKREEKDKINFILKVTVLTKWNYFLRMYHRERAPNAKIKNDAKKKKGKNV